MSIALKGQHIQVLVAIAEHGSLCAAAKALGKSQPGLTQALRQGEDELGLPIIVRTSRGVVLTPIGERVLLRARTITSEINRLDEEVSQLRGELTGPARPADLAREIAVEFLMEGPIHIITVSDSPMLKARSLGELEKAQWIMIGAPGRPGDSFCKPFLDHGFTPPHATTTLETYYGALSLVESLGAVCTFPVLLLDDVEKTSRIAPIPIPIPIRETIEPLRLSLIHRSGISNDLYAASHA